MKTRTSIVLLFVALNLILSACSTTPTPIITTPNPTLTSDASLTPAVNFKAGTLGTIFPELASLPETATKLRLKNDFDSFSYYKNHYILERTGQGFEGEGIFTAGSYFQDSQEATTTREISMPINNAKNFIQMLLETEATIGTYIPLQEETDNYPSLEIEIESLMGIISIYSKSQGQNHVPWGATFNKQRFVINSDAPTIALRSLQPYLKTEVQDELSRQVRSPKVDYNTIPPFPSSTPPLIPSKTASFTQIYNIYNHPNHTLTTFDIAFSSDSNLFATIGQFDHLIRLWTKEGKLLQIIENKEARIATLAFSPDSKTLAGSYDTDICLWEIATGKRVATLNNEDDYIDDLKFTLDGTKLITTSGASGSELKVWDISTKKIILRSTGMQFVLTNNNNRILLFAIYETTIRSLDITNGEISDFFNFDKEFKIENFAISPNNQFLATINNPRGVSTSKLKIWEISTGKLLINIDAPHGMLRFSPNGETVAVSGANEIKLWEVNSGNEIKIPQEAKLYIRDFSFSPDNSLLVTVGDEIKAWNTSNYQTAFLIEENTALPRSLTLSPEGKTLAVGTKSGAIELYTTIDGKLINSFKTFEADANSVAFSPDGKILAATGASQTSKGLIKLINSNDGKDILTLNTNAHNVWSLAFSPDGKTLACATSDYSVILWEVITGKKLITLKGKVPDFYEFYTVAFAPDGKTLAAAGTGDSNKNYYPIRLWDTSTYQEKGQLLGNTTIITTLAFSPDGKILVSGSGQLNSTDNEVPAIAKNSDITIRLWNLETTQEQASLLDRQGFVTNDLAFSPDGKILASSHSNGLLNLWDVKTAKLLSSTNTQNKSLSKFLIAFLPDGKSIISAHEDSSIKKWQITK